MADDAEKPKINKDDFVQEPLAVGWFCPNKEKCGVFNGDAQEFLLICRCCDAPRPKRKKTAFSKDRRWKRDWHLD